MLAPQPLEALWRPADLVGDFDDLTRLGGRLVGSTSELAARDLLRGRLQRIPGASCSEHEFDYRSWHSTLCELTVDGERLPCHPLIWSGETPQDGIEAELIALGRGGEADFRAAGGKVAGKFALVRHEYPFARTTIHRRLKFNWAREAGAAGFIIANDQPGRSMVAGSCGQDSPDNIPGIGISRELGQRLATLPGARLRLRHRSERRTATGANLIAELPGRGREWVVVCAHYDGHDLAQSALDNATGVIAALAIARAFASTMAHSPRGLRVILFTAEESGLLGSRRYVDSLSEAACREIALVINLDTLAGSDRFGCLTSEFAELRTFVDTVGREAKVPFECVEPLLRNSDHYNFARRGIPALRLVAGFDDANAGARRLLTETDTRDRVTTPELMLGTRVAADLAWAALHWPGLIATHRAERPD